MSPETMTPQVFVAKWKGSTRTERAAAQEHFIDICSMVGAVSPNAADPTGEWYAFEKGAEKQSGDAGFADVWRRKYFAWEYKRKKKDLVILKRNGKRVGATVTSKSGGWSIDLERLRKGRYHAVVKEEILGDDAGSTCEPDRSRTIRV